MLLDDGHRIIIPQGNFKLLVDSTFHELHNNFFVKIQASQAPLLGHSQLIPGMADFSQGVFLQSVGRVKKRRANGYRIPKTSLDI